VGGGLRVCVYLWVVMDDEEEKEDKDILIF
jgi:hypothetical protein